MTSSDASTGGGYVYIVHARFPEEDRLADWHRWYDDVHVPQMLSVPGIRAVRRFRDVGAPDWFAAVYEVESPAVFDHPRYAEVRGWGPWVSVIDEWRRELLCRVPVGTGTS